MKFSVILRRDLENARSPFRVVAPNGSEVEWVNHLLDQQRVRGVAETTLRSYAYDLLHFLRWWVQGKHATTVTDQALTEATCRVGQWRLAGFDDAAVSIALPKIPEGFPQSGFKAGISDAAFPVPWFAIALRALCCHCFTPALCQGRCAYKHLRASGATALPQGPSLRSGLCCPGPSTLK